MLTPRRSKLIYFLIAEVSAIVIFFLAGIHGNLADIFTGGRIPNANGRIAARTGDGLAVLAESNSPDRLGVAAVNQQFLSAGRVPKANDAVLRSVRSRSRSAPGR